LLAALCLSSCVSTPPRASTSLDPAAELAAARQASQEQRWQEAAGRWSAILQRADENSREACVQSARALIEMRQPEGAQKMAELGLRTFPSDAKLYELKGNALEAQGFRRAAETAYEHALIGDGDQGSALLSLASLRCDLGLYQAAIDILEPRLNAEAASPRELALAGKAYKSVRNYPRAYECFARAFELEAPRPSQLVAAASMYADASVRKKDPHAAELSRAWLERALALDPQDTLGHLYLGMLAEDGGREEPAARSYRRAVETDPACVLALSTLAEFEARRGNLDLSKAMAQRALELEQEPDRRVELEKLANPPVEPTPEATEPSGG
jgi:tetratricopeptide (TPR) repeat protein